MVLGCGYRWTPDTPCSRSHNSNWDCGTGVSYQCKSSKRIQGGSIYDLESKFKDLKNSRLDI